MGLQYVEHCLEFVTDVQLMSVEHHYYHISSLCKPFYNLWTAGWRRIKRRKKKVGESNREVRRQDRLEERRGED